MVIVLRNRIKELRLAAGLTQAELADRMTPKESQQQVERWENGQDKLKISQAKRVARALGVDELAVVADLPTPLVGMRRVPVYGSVAASHFAEIRAEDVLFYVAYPTTSPQVFGLLVEGDSMDRVAPNGSVVLVDPSILTFEDEEPGVFRWHNAATFKRFRQRGTRQWLEPDSSNPVHGKLVPNGDDGFDVIGGVYAILKRFERIVPEAAD